MQTQAKDARFWVVVDHSGKVEIVPESADKSEHLHGLVGGYFEHTSFTIRIAVAELDFKQEALVNEEGHLIPLPMNRRIPNFAGNVVLCQTIDIPVEEDGIKYMDKDLAGLIKEEAESLFRMVSSFPLLSREEAEKHRPTPEQIRPRIFFDGKEVK